MHVELQQIGVMKILKMRKAGLSMARMRMVILSGKDVHLFEGYHGKLLLVVVKETLQLRAEQHVLVPEETMPRPVEKNRPTVQSSSQR
jgi:hypothetical protein